MIENSIFYKNIQTGLVPVLQEGVIDQLTAENSRWLNKKSQTPKVVTHALDIHHFQQWHLRINKCDVINGSARHKTTYAKSCA